MKDIFAFFTSDVGKVALGGLIAVSGQFLVSILNWIKEARFSKKRQRQEAEYLCMRLVLVFDDLVGALYNAVHDPLTTDAEGYTKSSVADPMLSMPTDGDYKALSAPLMYAVLAVPNRLAGIKEGLSSIGEYDSPPDFYEYYEYRRREFCKLGLSTLALIKSICLRYRIPPPERPEHYSPGDSFINELQKIDKLVEERSRRNLDMFRRLSSSPSQVGEALE